MRPVHARKNRTLAQGPRDGRGAPEESSVGRGYCWREKLRRDKKGITCSEVQFWYKRKKYAMQRDAETPDAKRGEEKMGQTRGLSHGIGWELER
jgi:hypothetical protein